MHDAFKAHQGMTILIFTGLIAFVLRIISKRYIHAVSEAIL